MEDDEERMALGKIWSAIISRVGRYRLLRTYVAMTLCSKVWARPGLLI